MEDFIGSTTFDEIQRNYGELDPRGSYDELYQVEMKDPIPDTVMVPISPSLPQGIHATGGIHAIASCIGGDVNPYVSKIIIDHVMGDTQGTNTITRNKIGTIGMAIFPLKDGEPVASQYEVDVIPAGTMMRKFRVARLWPENGPPLEYRVNAIKSLLMDGHGVIVTYNASNLPSTSNIDLVDDRSDEMVWHTSQLYGIDGDLLHIKNSTRYGDDTFTVSWHRNWGGMLDYVDVVIVGEQYPLPNDVVNTRRYDEVPFYAAIYDAILKDG